MSCQVYNKKTGRLMADSHNGLMYGLFALCIEPLEPRHNDFELSLVKIERGIENYKNPANAHPENQKYIAELKATRPDHLDDAFALLKKAKAKQCALVAK